eukprot:7029646-Prymnesium_polylepis.1
MSRHTRISAPRENGQIEGVQAAQIRRGAGQHLWAEYSDGGAGVSRPIVPRTSPLPLPLATFHLPDPMLAPASRVLTCQAWRAVSESGLKKSDPKFKLYLGLCAGADDKPGDHATNPPKLDIVFA